MEVEEGVVIEILNGGLARVMVDRGLSCERCSLCAKIEDGKPVAKAKNPIGAKEGERVRVEFFTRDFMISSFSVFGVLLVGTTLGIPIGYLFFRVFEWFSLDVFCIISCFALFILSFGVVHIMDKGRRRKGGVVCEIKQTLPPIKD